MINKKTLEKTAQLSSLRLSDSEQEKLLDEMQAIIEHFSALKEIRTEGVEPLYTPVKMENQWREDRIFYRQKAEQLIKRAPETQEGQVKVPKVVK